MERGAGRAVGTYRQSHGGWGWGDGGARLSGEGEKCSSTIYLLFLLTGFGAGFLGGLSPLPQILPPTFVLPKWGNIRAYKSCVEGSERSYHYDL